jgi:hypothetical protein
LLSWDVSAEAGFVYDEAAMLRDPIKGTLCLFVSSLFSYIYNLQSVFSLTQEIIFKNIVNRLCVCVCVCVCVYDNISLNKNLNSIVLHVSGHFKSTVWLRIFSFSPTKTLSVVKMSRYQRLSTVCILLLGVYFVKNP